MTLCYPGFGNKALQRNTTVALRSLVQDPAVSNTLHRANELQFKPTDVESARYFFSAIDRIANPAYLPSDEDIFRARMSGQGNKPTTFAVGEMTFRMCNMSGQWYGWRKWIHHFEHMKAVLFLIDLSRYDQILEESKTVRYIIIPDSLILVSNMVVELHRRCNRHV